ncbi:hypothetical protein IGI04_040357 [Brassica rapa subsp. trilocularis]|uniref:Replication protein A 70 kDa DNA-binding subunit B/D first OB fold domain-containing protein n=1 Tax=Brassica rapa subsp. trilocularis TaxID=1813537 RepID=A0ABQ7KQK9_BRACM|nr:hypothetical protein IGI04_040357 [Brassica rapa subsp. trilocularis]
MAEYNKLSEVTYNPAVKAWRFRVKLHRIYPFYSYVTNSGPYYNYILADEDGYKMEMNTYGNYKNFRGLEKEEGRWVEIFVVDVERASPCFKTTSSPFRLIASRVTQVRIIEPLKNRLFFDFKSIHAIPRMHWRDLKYPIDTMGVVFNTEAHLDAPSGPRMEFYIRDNIDHQIRCVVTGTQAVAFRDGLDDMSGGGRRQVIVVLKMWRVCESTNYFGPDDIWLQTEGGFADFRFNPRLPEVEEFRQSVLNSDPYVQKYGVEGLV